MELSNISGNRNPKKNSCIFLKESFSCILGNGNPENNSLYFRKRNFLTFREMKTSKGTSRLKNRKKTPLKCFLYFGKWNFLALGLKNFLYFRKELAKPKN